MFFSPFFVFEIIFCVVFMGYCVLVCRDFPHNLIASILVSLTFKDTSAGLKFLLGSEGLKG